MKIVRVIIWIGLVGAVLRGLFVFDMGGSAKDTYPTASAICFIGGIIGSILMFRLDRGNSVTGSNKTDKIVGGILLLIGILMAFAHFFVK